MPDEEVVKKRKPKGTKFAQQTHWAWEPKINMFTAGLWMAGFGLPILILGVALLVTTKSAAEIVVSYGTHPNCLNCRNTAATRVSEHCKACLPKAGPCRCIVRFHVTTTLNTPVMVYYQLENFYQSHRRYIKSRDNSQLWGKIFEKGYKPVKPDSICEPYDKQGKHYTYPCGAIANSMFSDTLEIRSASELPLPLVIEKDNIAWDEDLDYKFKNPEGLDKNTVSKKASKESVAFNKHFVKPAAWEQSTWEKFWRDGGVKGPDFVNWMSPSPFATLRKFYGVIKSVPSCRDPSVLCEGYHELHIDYQFPVDPYKGQKSLVLATTSGLGTPNSFIGWFTLGFGILLSSLAVLFVIVHKLFKKIKHKHRIHPTHYLHDNEVIIEPLPVPSEQESELSEATDVTDVEPSETESSRPPSPSTSVKNRRGGSPPSKDSKKKPSSKPPKESPPKPKLMKPKRDSPPVNPSAVKEVPKPRFIEPRQADHTHAYSKFKSRKASKHRKDNKKRAKSAPPNRQVGTDTEDEVSEVINLDRSKSNPKSKKLKIL